MGYKEALEAAGAEVMAFEEFGSYQGDWWAKVRYKGELGWVQGSYGSCSGCDAFEAEFGWDDGTPEKLAEFGRGYLDDLLLGQEQAEEEASRYIEWDSDAQEMVAWLKANALPANSK